MTSEQHTDYKTVIEKLQSDIEGLKTQLFYLINTKIEFTNTELEATRLELQQTQTQLNEVLTEQFVGAVCAFAMPEPPLGWLECNEQAVSRIDYARLFNKIGSTFGAGDKETTFNLPDLKGVFVRGWERVAGGHDSGRTFGTYQEDQMQSHKHEDEGHSHVGQTALDGQHKHNLESGDYDDISSTGKEEGLIFCDRLDDSDDSDDYITRRISTHSHNLIIETGKSVLSVPISSKEGAEVRHGNETRPKNVALLFCIKY